MMNKWSVKSILMVIGSSMVFTAILISTLVYFITMQWTAAAGCLLSAGIVSVWAAVGVRILKSKLAFFSDEICLHIDKMMEGKEEIKRLHDEDTLLDRIEFKLSRLYHSLQTSKAQVALERADLQSLISDVSHQIKTPATNLKLASGVLLEQELSRSEQIDYLQIVISQVEKLDFLMSAMIKSSRLESGAITLVQKMANLFETLAASVSGVFPSAQEKKMNITVNGSETLLIPHDSRWTSEALFNILDNAVKYTPFGGSISINVIQWEAYTRIDIADNGRGIEESRQGAIFSRFYREPEVHEIDGLGIGLYLSREIIAKQGGYIKVSSQPGCGSVFSVFLPNYS